MNMRPADLKISALLLALLLPAMPAGAALSIYMGPEELAERADLIVEAHVVRTASGYDPLTGALSTYITLDVKRVHRGPSDLERVVIREPGGRYGGIVHELDAVPRYETGEHVFAFLESAGDGALRTAGMFFGKYKLSDTVERMPHNAIRELDGQGTIIGGGEVRQESVRIRDLVAVAATSRSRRSERGSRILAAPPEYDRLQWNDVAGEPDRILDAHLRPDGPLQFAKRPDLTTPGRQIKFIPLSSSHPTRWTEPDHGSAVTIQIDRSANPLGDGAAAVTEMERAMAAWNNVPEARITLLTGNSNYDYPANHPGSPASVYHGINAILFGDPYDDISDPVGCSGTLAIGGYWRSSSRGDPVNNVEFHPAMQLYVIFNDNFECYLQLPDNLAEVAAHELGHGLGFGHSVVPDAIMRATAYGNRGPRLGNDDCDAAHCHYPHTFTLSSPNGGESWEAGSLQAIEWLVTEEQGPDPGVVTLEYSANGGADWITISEDEPNDGHYGWLVPTTEGDDILVRVARYSRSGSAPPQYPSSCSNDISDSSFSIVAPTSLAGTIPSGGGGGLLIEKGPYGMLRLGWDPSCSDDVTDYAIYSGDLGALRLGVWEHAPLTCSAGADLAEYIHAGIGSRYFLVAPIADGAEGATGLSSDGASRPVAAAACAPRESSSVCN
jgi:hypothetical protein